MAPFIVISDIKFRIHNIFVSFVVNLKSNMETTRQQKVSRLIQKEMGIIFQQEAQQHAPGKLISVSTVRVTPNLAVAKIYLSIFPSDKSDDIVKEINKNVGYFRRILGNKVRHQLRIVPELNFFNDDSLDYIENIDNLLK